MVLFLRSKVIGNVPFIEKNDGKLDRMERERERRRVVSRRSSNGKYGFFGRVVNHAYSRNESAHRTTIIALSLLIGIPN